MVEISGVTRPPCCPLFRFPGFAGQVLDHRSLWSWWTLLGLAPARTRCSATYQPFLGPWSQSWHTGYGDASPTEFGSAGGYTFQWIVVGIEDFGSYVRCVITSHQKMEL